MQDLKEIYKEPVFYYAIVPVAVAMWPILVWAVYLPSVEQKWQQRKEQYKDAQPVITQILEIDSDRLEFSESGANSQQFDYAVVVDKIMNSVGIPASKYRLSTDMVITSGGQKSQRARMEIERVSVSDLARFLSTMQLKWANLQCTKVELRKNEDTPDNWNVDLNFKYFF
jgi:hypothetical protein